MTYTEVTYHGAHSRIRAQRGPAKNYTCSCGVPAADWAFNHSASETYVRYTPRIYSLNPFDYDPLCIACHQERDRIAGQRKPVSNETRAKLSAQRRGVKKSPEHVAKVAAANRGPRPHRQGIPQSAEHKAKRILATTHTRWHLGRGILDENCSLCVGDD